MTVDTGVVSPLCAGAGDDLRLVHLLEPQAVALNGLGAATPYWLEWFKQFGNSWRRAERGRRRPVDAVSCEGEDSWSGRGALLLTLLHQGLSNAE